MSLGHPCTVRHDGTVMATVCQLGLGMFNVFDKPFVCQLEGMRSHARAMCYIQMAVLKQTRVDLNKY